MKKLITAIADALEALVPVVLVLIALGIGVLVWQGAPDTKPLDPVVPAATTSAPVGYSGADAPTRDIEVLVKVHPYDDPDSIYLVVSYEASGETLVVPNPHISNDEAAIMLGDLKFIAQRAELP